MTCVTVWCCRHTQTFTALTRAAARSTDGADPAAKAAALDAAKVGLDNLNACIKASAPREPWSMLLLPHPPPSSGSIHVGGVSWACSGSHP